MGSRRLYLPLDMWTLAPPLSPPLPPVKIAWLMRCQSLAIKWCEKKTRWRGKKKKGFFPICLASYLPPPYPYPTPPPVINSCLPSKIGMRLTCPCLKKKSLIAYVCNVHRITQFEEAVGGVGGGERRGKRCTAPNQKKKKLPVHVSFTRVMLYPSSIISQPGEEVQNLGKKRLLSRIWFEKKSWRYELFFFFGFWGLFFLTNTEIHPGPPPPFRPCSFQRQSQHVRRKGGVKGEEEGEEGEEGGKRFEKIFFLNFLPNFFFFLIYKIFIKKKKKKRWG